MLVGVLIGRFVAEKMMGKFKGRKKGATEMLQVLFWLILAVVTLIIVIAGIVILFGKGEGMISYLKDIWRFGG